MSVNAGYTRLPTNEGSFPIVYQVKPRPAMTRAFSLKYASLVTLTVQNAASSIMMRMARTQKDLFIASTAVIIAEMVKILTCIIVIAFQEGSWRKVLQAVKTQIIDRPRDTLKVSVPAIVYYIQNNLIYIGATHLDAATAQVTYQLKILTTAIFSVFLLKKSLSKLQWMALLILFAGVALVQLVQLTNHSKSAAGQSPMIGFLAILSACFLSGFAGVYFEMILKGSSEVSLWIRNIQLASFAVPFGLIQVFATDYSIISGKGFFFGYSALTWTVILLQAQGGLLVAVVVKYADNILKGFATSLAIIISSVVSVFLFDFEITFQFVIGTLLVISSIFLYSKQPSNGKNSSLLPQSSSGFKN